MSGAHVSILRCRDGSYYVGSTRKDLEERISEHNNGRFRGYTSSRLPVELLFAEHFVNITDAIAAERQLKDWSRAKKEALARGDLSDLKRLAMEKRKRPHASTGSA
jgi:putative endonuclease